MMYDILQSGLNEWEISLEQQSADWLEEFAARVRETNKVMNLTAITAPEEFARKHVLDCASLLTVTDFSHRSVIDVGCGAGFPGMPIKLLSPTCSMTLLDSLGKRISFLQNCIDEMQLSGIQAVYARAEDYAKQHREQYDLVVSRAVAKLSVLAELSLPMVRVGGYFLAMKSTDIAQEMEEAAPAIAILGGEVKEQRDICIPGTEIIHRIVVIEKKQPSPEKYPRRFQKIVSSPLSF